jgi:hypothetical protein
MKVVKIEGKLIKIEEIIWNNFCNCNILRFSTDFELLKRFRVKAGLTDLCSYRLIVTLFPNQLELHFRQIVLHSDLQSFHYHLVDMHKLSPKIQDVMEFSRWLSVKQILQNSLSLEFVLYSSVCTFETNISRAQ